MRLTSSIRSSFFQLLVIYSLLVAVIYFGFISRYALHFQIFASILAIMGVFIVFENKEGRLPKKLHLLLFTLAILIILILRIIPYIGNSVPIGYDSGIYKYAIEHGLERSDAWIVTGPTMEPAFLYMMEVFKLFFSADSIIKWGFILSVLILGIALYWCTRLHFGQKPAIISLLFYSVSVTQFLTFTFMYFRNILGLALMLFSIGLLKKYESNKEKKYLFLFILLAGILGATHRATFYIFGLSYFFYAFLIPLKDKYNVDSFSQSRNFDHPKIEHQSNRTLKHAVVHRFFDLRKLGLHILFGIVIILVALSFYMGRFWPAITTIVKPVVGSFVDTGESPGTFISFTQYQFITLAYLPLALLGVFSILKNRKFNFLVIWVIINAAIVYFQFFFFNRFIVHLDVVLLMFAGLGSMIVINKRKWLGIGVLAVLFIASAYTVTQESLHTQNQVVTEKDIALIEELSTITEESAIIMSMSKEYSPWVIAYSNRTIIAPGLFDENRWNEAEWNAFWFNADESETIELMNRYDTTRPIYLYTGTKSFNNSCFNRFLEKDGRNVYEYTC